MATKSVHEQAPRNLMRYRNPSQISWAQKYVRDALSAAQAAESSNRELSLKYFQPLTRDTYPMKLSFFLGSRRVSLFLKLSHSSAVICTTRGARPARRGVFVMLVSRSEVVMLSHSLSNERDRLLPGDFHEHLASRSQTSIAYCIKLCLHRINVFRDH